MAPKPNEKNVLEDESVKMQEIREKFKQILKSNGINNPVSEVIINDAGLRGEGFASLTQYVTVKFEDPEKKPLNLFVKVQTGSPTHTQMLNEMKSFEKEARFLTAYVKAAKEMCKLKGCPDFIDFYPKCYYGDSEMIVLENLVLDKGYSLKNKEDLQDLDCAKFALKTLAKHHALGHVMIAENGGSENFFKKFPDLDLEAFGDNMIFMRDIMGGMLNNNVESSMKILEKNLQVPGAEEGIEKLRQFQGKPLTIIVDSLKVPANQKDSTDFFVLGHGDYWNNNMMFKVDGPTKNIVHHVAIDFQITRYNSPALDLTYYFFTSVQPHIRRTHLLELLTLYKDTLNTVTEDFGYPTNLTLDQIFKDFRGKVGYGLWFGFLMSVLPGPALFKNVDISKVDINEWPALLSELLNKWMNENPDKAKKTAKEIVEVMKEYEQLKR